VHITHKAVIEDKPEPIELDVVYEDKDLLLINKPAGLVVHPAAGHRQGTLVNALLHYDALLEKLPRAGIVHRLDQYTSGLLLVARHPVSYQALVLAMQERRIKREYQALVQGEMIAGGKVDAPIGRNPKHRLRMAVVKDGKPACTHYRVLERFGRFNWIRLQLDTGRTHQIRVHMTYIAHPLVGDQVYNRHRNCLPSGLDDQSVAIWQGFKRQALHAWRLSFEHPVSKEPMVFEKDLPEDMQALLTILQNI
jgi:23S rRNA pseudouridine1911/1915/1917 synthase